MVTFTCIVKWATWPAFAQWIKQRQKILVRETSALEKSRVGPTCGRFWRIYSPFLPLFMFIFFTFFRRSYLSWSYFHMRRVSIGCSVTSGLPRRYPGFAEKGLSRVPRFIEELGVQPLSVYFCFSFSCDRKFLNSFHSPLKKWSNCMNEYVQSDFHACSLKQDNRNFHKLAMLYFSVNFEQLSCSKQKHLAQILDESFSKLRFGLCD